MGYESRVDVARLRTYEPEIDMYLAPMISAVSDLLCISRKEALKDCFNLDEPAFRYLKYNINERMGTP